MKLGDLACPAGVEPATYGLEGLANLLMTMVDNGLSRPDLGVRQNRGDRGVGRHASTKIVRWNLAQSI